MEQKLAMQLQEAVAVLDSEDMLTTVTLFTPMYRLENGLRTERDPRTQSFGRNEILRQDTLHGIGAVADFLAARRVQVEPGRPFRFTSKDLQFCEAAIVQYGEYPVRQAGLGSREGMQEYTVLWVPTEDGGWKADRIWMAPIVGTTRAARIATGCRPMHSLGRTYAEWRSSGVKGMWRENRRGGIRGFIRTGERNSLTEVESAFDANGWTLNRRSSTDDFPFGVEAFLNLTPDMDVVLTAAAGPSGVMNARYQSTAYRAQLEYSSYAAALLLGYEVSQVRLAAGPGMVLRTWEWSEELLYISAEPGNPSSETAISPGLVVQLGTVQPLTPGLYLQAGGTYGLFGSSRSQSYRDAEPVEMPVGGLTFNFGIGWWW